MPQKAAGGFLNTKTQTIFIKKSAPKPTIVFDSYWRLASERQKIFYRRLNHFPSPWTTDPVLNEFKFTNAYRASDRVSQYLIGSVIGTGTRSISDQFFRILLFKIFNKIETWEYLERELGSISWKPTIINRINTLLNQQCTTGKSIYSAAYIMPSGGKDFRFPKKHTMHLHLLKQMMLDRLPEKLHQSDSMAEAFHMLRAYPTIGDFLAYQFATDLNYSDVTSFSEMEFVVPGPGAKDGIRKCFSSLGDYSESDLIKIVAESQESEFLRLGLTFDSLWGRPLQLIDCQNIFCETDKYARVAHPDFAGRTGRTRIKQRFQNHGDLPAPTYPTKWKLNKKIRAYFGELDRIREPLKDSDVSTFL